MSRQVGISAALQPESGGGIGRSVWPACLARRQPDRPDRRAGLKYVCSVCSNLRKGLYKVYWSNRQSCTKDETTFSRKSRIYENKNTNYISVYKSI
jgi:hypothetical protein